MDFLFLGLDAGLDWPVQPGYDTETEDSNIPPPGPPSSIFLSPPELLKIVEQMLFFAVFGVSLFSVSD